MVGERGAVRRMSADCLLEADRPEAAPSPSVPDGVGQRRRRPAGRRRSSHPAQGRMAGSTRLPARRALAEAVGRAAAQA